MTACDLLQGSPYQGYTYAYPHKTAYRRLPHPIPLAEAWAEEPQDALFLYLHVPFCATRCGYCNLFSLAGADRGLVRHYLNALTRQAATVREALPRARFSRLALGGGTPTLLAVDDLDALFELCRDVMGVDARAVPTSVEVSPATATPEKLALLHGHGSTASPSACSPSTTRNCAGWGARRRPRPPSGHLRASARPASRC